MTAKIAFDTPVDVPAAQKEVMDFHAPLLAAGRQIRPRLTFFNGDEAVMTITSRMYNNSDESDRNHALRNMMFMVPAITPTLSILSLNEKVQLVDGETDALVIIAFGDTGAIAEVFPYEIHGSEVTYREDAQLANENNGSFSDYIGRMLPVFIRQSKSAFTAQNMVDFLTTNNYEIEFHGDWDLRKLRSFFPS